jgi:hypothetical protein
MSDDKPDPVFVLKAEAGGEPFPFEYQGEKFTIPHVRDMDVFAVRQVIADATNEDDLMVNLYKQAMGPEQFDQLKALGLTQHVFANLVMAWRRHCGLEEGESSASSA